MSAFLAVPQLERCSRRAKILSREPNIIAAFFHLTSMMGRFVFKIRKLSAIFEAKFDSPFGAGMGSNPISTDFCWHTLRLFWFIAFWFYSRFENLQSRRSQMCVLLLVLSYELQDTLVCMPMPQIVFLQLHHHSYVFAKFGRNKTTFHVRKPRAQLILKDFLNDWLA